ncbi:cilia- and flagella-associated protein 100 isoform X1 [Astyanax mexicanus]|uniref:cilia- and flagella-associated protein 100 isoform X1 n=2 Tax=Astyanax mexicanus TaxID=7994 RepID=UPI0020CADCCD|nr:cilia- and flagella-associated protein 100 isoform X1 [Astyanax mexicanus]
MLSPFSSVQEGNLDEIKSEPNPFKMPEDNNIFLLRNAEKTPRKQEYRKELSLPVQEKKTYTGRMRAKQTELRKKLRDGLEDEEEGKSSSASQLIQYPPACKVIMIKDRNIEKESVREFISKKREMFYLQHALVVKREEIEKLEEVATHEEKKLVRAERMLKDDAMLFDSFLKENDKNTVEAIKIAEQETKAKLEKMAEIKRLNAKMVAIKSDISKYEDTLQEYKLYKGFLFELSPLEWQEKQREKNRRSPKPSSTPPTTTDKREREVRSRETERGKKTPQTDRRRENRSSVGSRELPPLREGRAPSRYSMKSTPQSGKISPASETDSSEYEEEPELYFTEPQQLLDLLSELEEQNLSLIQNAQETEEGLVEFRNTVEQTRKNMEHEALQLKQQIDIMTETIQKEKERTAELELKVRLFNFGNENTDEDDTLNALSRKVEAVYRSCIGSTEDSLSTLQMLTTIEGRLGELLEKVEMIPADRLAIAEKAKERERRLRLRDEKIYLQKQQQEERMKKAMERAQAQIKRTSGKKLMPRSLPPVRKLKDDQHDDVTDKEKEEHLYFFT